MSLLPDRDWIEIPGGSYWVGIDQEEADEFWSEYWLSNFWSGSCIPPSLAAGIPRQLVTVSGFRISKCVSPITGVTFRDAFAAAKINECSLPTECEWEIAERYGPQPISAQGFDEWCLDYFDANRNGFENTLNPVRAGQKNDPISAPRGRHAIRGQGIEIYHPAMRFHGAIADRPYGTTGFRIVQRDKPLNRLDE